jgi:hypothetical protein
MRSHPPKTALPKSASAAVVSTAFALVFSASACIERVDPIEPDDGDASVPRYVTWGTFTPGSGSSDTGADVDKVYGAPDGTSLHLGLEGSVTVTFGDNLIYDRAGADFIIHGTWEGSEAGTVFASPDGADYEHIGIIEDGANTVDMAQALLGRVVYLRVQDNGVGNGFEIDAIEVVPAPTD